MAELVARVKALIRRRAPAGTRHILRVGDLVWEPDRRRVERGDARLDLTPQEFAVLTLLLERQGQIVSREALGRVLWGGSAEHPALRSPNALDAMIRRLRAKVDAPFPTALIHTCRGQGLILEARS
jgi:two-component system copper resistance phosphate regulon response regulator CusR